MSDLFKVPKKFIKKQYREQAVLRAFKPKAGPSKSKKRKEKPLDYLRWARKNGKVVRSKDGSFKSRMKLLEKAEKAGAMIPKDIRKSIVKRRLKKSAKKHEIPYDRLKKYMASYKKRPTKEQRLARKTAYKELESPQRWPIALPREPDEVKTEIDVDNGVITL